MVNFDPDNWHHLVSLDGTWCAALLQHHDRSNYPDLPTVWLLFRRDTERSGGWEKCQHRPYHPHTIFEHHEPAPEWHDVFLIFDTEDQKWHSGG